METNTTTTSNIRTYKGIKIYPAINGWRVFISENIMTTTRSLRNIKIVINGALASWATAIDGKLIATPQETPAAPEVFASSMQNTQDRAFRKFDELTAQLAQTDGTIKTIALFDLAGNWVPARMVTSKFGTSWLVLDANGKSTGTFVPHASAKRETQAKRGYVEGFVLVEASVQLSGGFRPHASIGAKHEVGTVKPIKVITTDRFNNNKEGN
jgi:hypothetical protein